MTHIYSFFIETKEFWFVAMGVFFCFSYLSGRGIKDKGKDLLDHQIIHGNQIWEILSHEDWYKSFFVFLIGGTYIVLLTVSILGIIFH